MERAYCYHPDVDDDVVAEEFASLSDRKRELYRSFLSCPICGADAAFRRASRDGKNACFSARHEEGCAAASPAEGRYVAEVVQEVAQILKDPTVIELDLDEPDHQLHPGKARSPLHKSAPNSKQRIGRHHIVPPTKPALPTSLGGQRLLRYLVYSTRFRTADVDIRLPGMNRSFKPERLFRRFTEVTIPEADTEGRWHGYWGLITSADKDGAWLNTGGTDTVSVLIPENLRTDVYNRWGITDGDCLAGAHGLVFAKPKRSRGGKTYLKVRKANSIALWPHS